MKLHIIGHVNDTYSTIFAKFELQPNHCISCCVTGVGGFALELPSKHRLFGSVGGNNEFRKVDSAIGVKVK